jgi:hypothetical protein
MWGNQDDDSRQVFRLYQMTEKDGYNDWENIGVIRKRVGKPTVKVYYYPNTITDDEITLGTRVGDMLLLDKSEYSVYTQNGDFVVIISCNRRKMVIDEQGGEVEVPESYQGGVYTEFKGFITLEIDDEDMPMNWQYHDRWIYIKPIRQKLKFPQHADKGETFMNPSIFPGDETFNDAWRKENYTFCGGNIYTLSKFHGIVANSHCTNAECSQTYGFISCDSINNACHGSTNLNVGIIQTNDYGYTGNTLYQMCSNSCIICDGNGWAGAGTLKTFGANWLNMSIYLPQTGWVYDNYSYIYDWRANSQFTYSIKGDTFYMQTNSQQIAGLYTDTMGFARSDLNWTDIVCVPKTDVLKINNLSKKGFIKEIDLKESNALEGTFYRNGSYKPPGWNCAAPFNGGRCCGTCENPTVDQNTYFFKGIDTSDCVAYLVCLGIV